MKFEDGYELRSENRIMIEGVARMLCISERNLCRHIEREEGIKKLVYFITYGIVNSVEVTYSLLKRGAYAKEDQEK